MKQLCLSFVLIGILSGQSNIGFRYDTFADIELSDQAENIINSTVMWVGQSSPVWMENNQRFSIKLLADKSVMKNNLYGWSLPNFSMFIKASRNLTLSLKMTGFSLKEDLPQVIGGGLRLNLGSDENPLWQFSADRSQINGLRDFRLNTTTLTFFRKYHIRNFTTSLGIGVNTFKGRALNFLEEIEKNIEGEKNFFNIHVSIPAFGFHLGTGLSIYSQMNILRFSLERGFH
ncbi:MAG: hypothetical protein ISR83_02215 [Candidatus Marinimicrobia bacterium]|nr:hypothetical protein [Candidatus Neomarinimicrobiota bacterium]